MRVLEVMTFVCANALPFALTEPLLALKTLKDSKPQIHASGGPMPAAYYFV